MKLSSALFLSLLFVSAALVIGSSQASASLPNSRINRERFARLLREGKVAQSSRFLYLFSSPQGVEHELLAQYFMMSCQPRRALSEIQKIDSREQRQLFMATLLGLISVEKPKPVAPQASSTLTPSKAAPSSELAFPIDPEEIWPDEWAEMRLPRLCQKMVTLSSVTARAQAREKARRLFEEVPFSAYEDDFALVALAVEVSAKLQDAPKLLERFRAHHQDPRYRLLLEKELARQREADPKEGEVLASDPRGISLNALELKSVQLLPSPVQIPYLVRLEEMRR